MVDRGPRSPRGAGVPPAHLAPPRRHPDQRRRAPSTAPGLYDDHTYYDVRGSPTTGAGWSSPAASARPAATACGSPSWRPTSPCRRSRPSSRRPTTCAPRRGWTATVASTCCTTDGAPRWRLAVTDPRTPGREHWRALVAEDPGANLDAVRYLDVARRGRRCLVVLARGRHAVARARAPRPRRTPARGAVVLPGPGSLTGLSVADRAPPTEYGQLWFGWTDFVTPTEVHRFDAATGEVLLEATAPGAVDGADGAQRAAHVHQQGRHHGAHVRAVTPGAPRRSASRP